MRTSPFQDAEKPYEAPSFFHGGFTSFEAFNHYFGWFGWFGWSHRLQLGLDFRVQVRLLPSRTAGACAARGSAAAALLGQRQGCGERCRGQQIMRCVTWKMLGDLQWFSMNNRGLIIFNHQQMVSLSSKNGGLIINTWCFNHQNCWFSLTTMHVQACENGVNGTPQN